MPKCEAAIKNDTVDPLLVIKVLSLHTPNIMLIHTTPLLTKTLLKEPNLLYKLSAHQELKKNIMKQQ
jgi:hypothetical protein